MKTAAFLGILEDIVNVPKGTLKMEDGPKTVKSWDSMAQVTILATIDGELGVELSDDSMTRFQTVGQLIDILKSKGVIED